MSTRWTGVWSGVAHFGVLRVARESEQHVLTASLHSVSAKVLHRRGGPPDDLYRDDRRDRNGDRRDRPDARSKLITSDLDATCERENCGGEYEADNRGEHGRGHPLSS